jgi:predicted RNase H-like HicB family nuclease
MKSFTAVVERDWTTGVFVGHVPGWPGAQSQGTSLAELRHNLEEVVAMLLEHGDPDLEGEFVGTFTIEAGNEAR